MKNNVLSIFLCLVTFHCFSAYPPIGTQPNPQTWAEWVERLPNAQGYINSLSMSKSPYLLQHAENPIDWSIWPIPKKNDRLVFLSIGYASCHWCHQMNKHTFINDDVAKVLNQNFVSIKVDRDEYPVIDYQYLQIQQAVTGEGGWPISVIALPDGSPVWIGSYEDATSMKNIAQRMARIWQVQPDFLYAQADNIKTIAAQTTVPADDFSYSQHLLTSRDAQFFGKQGKVKFPEEAELWFMLSQYQHTPELKTVLIQHLDTLANSPLHDGVNGGFYRYATQSDWSIPHFEKMLYTQVQLLGLYSEAYMHFQNPMYKRVAHRIFNFLQRNMLNENGLYMTSINADWNHIEGGYYLWPKTILDNLNITSSIAHIRNDQYQYFGLASQPKLKALQDKRPPPEMDQRGITGLNGLALWALVKAHEAGIKHTLEAAKSIAKTLIESRVIAKDIHRVCYHTGTCIPGKIDDYTYLALGFAKIATYQQQYQPISRDMLTALFESLDTQDAFTIEDHESISPLAMAIQSAHELAVPIPFHWMNAKNMSTSLNASVTDYLNAFMVSKFARDHGYVLKFERNTSTKISLVMEKGWHTNSRHPIQDYLKPTYISGINTPLIHYPQGKITQVEFDDESLSLFEGITNIVISQNPVNANAVLNTQACSDSLCLPPESIPLNVQLN